MRYFNQLITISGLLFSSLTYAIDWSIEALYWQASETVDWALTNNLNPVQQVISYKTINFDHAPGFRIAAALEKDAWNTRALYTNYHVQAKAQTDDHVISAFMPSKFVETFYDHAQTKFTIHYDMLDLDLYKKIQINEPLTLNPLIGLKTGQINQKINTQYQGLVTVLEQVSNKFTGFGPKIGLESEYALYHKNDYQYTLIANLSSTYMWGKWSIHDILTRNDNNTLGSVQLGKRDFGSLALQGLIGLNMEYKNYSIKVAYELSDWFNQFQVFDNATGTHMNDLILQGASLGLSYRC